MADLLSGIQPVTFAEMAEELRRELKMRRAVYPGQVQLKRMSQARADRQIEIMEAVLATIEGLHRQSSAAREAAHG